MRYFQCDRATAQNISVTIQVDILETEEEKDKSRVNTYFMAWFFFTD